MQSINICLAVLALTLSSVAQSTGAEVDGPLAAARASLRSKGETVSGSAHDELVRLVSRMRVELRKMEPKSKRCSALAAQIGAIEPVKSLVDEQTGGDNTQARRLIAASSLLKQHASSLTSLMAYLDECANELGANAADLESIGQQVRAAISEEQAAVVDAGAQVEKATAELAADWRARLEAQVSELKEEKAQLQLQLEKWTKNFEASEEQYKICNREKYDWIQRSNHLEGQWKRCENLRG